MQYILVHVGRLCKQEQLFLSRHHTLGNLLPKLTLFIINTDWDMST